MLLALLNLTSFLGAVNLVVGSFAKFVGVFCDSRCGIVRGVENPFQRLLITIVTASTSLRAVYALARVDGGLVAGFLQNMGRVVWGVYIINTTPSWGSLLPRVVGPGKRASCVRSCAVTIAARCPAKTTLLIARQ